MQSLLKNPYIHKKTDFYFFGSLYSGIIPLDSTRKALNIHPQRIPIFPHSELT